MVLLTKNAMIRLRRHSAPRILVLTLFVTMLAMGIVTASQLSRLASGQSTTTPQTSMATGAYFDHTVIIIMEDHGIQDVCAQNPPPCLGSNIVLANPTGCTVTDCSLVNDLNSASAPNFMWLTPNNCNNMHGFTGICPTSIPMGDNYLKGLVPNILNSNTFTTQRAALFIVFDEGNGWCPLNGSSEDCVYAVWAGPLAKTGFATSNLYNHYSWTKTIETNWNLAGLTSNDANAKPMTEFFKSSTPPVRLSNSVVGQTVSFTGSASGGTAPYNYAWNFGDASTGSGSSASHIYQTAGVYTVVLTVTDAAGHVVSATNTVTVTLPLSASFTYSPSNPAPLTNIQFTATATGRTAPYNYSR